MEYVNFLSPPRMNYRTMIIVTTIVCFILITGALMNHLMTRDWRARVDSMRSDIARLSLDSNESKVDSVSVADIPHLRNVPWHLSWDRILSDIVRALKRGGVGITTLDAALLPRPHVVIEGKSSSQEGVIDLVVQLKSSRRLGKIFLRETKETADGVTFRIWSEVL